MTSLRRQPGVKSWYGSAIEQAKQTAAHWNERHPVGTVVELLDDQRHPINYQFATTSAAREMAGAASLFVPVADGWVPLKRIRVVETHRRRTMTEDGREAQARNDLAARAHPNPQPGKSPSDDGDDRRAPAVLRDGERAEVGHTPAVGNGDGPCASRPSGEAPGSCPGDSGSTPDDATIQHRTATSIRVLCSLLFSGGSLPTHRLADRCNLTVKRCGQALSVLHDAGLVENPRHGHWRAKRLVVALHRELVSLVAAQVEARHARLGC